jgi:hypothetical protein
MDIESSQGFNFTNSKQCDTFFDYKEEKLEKRNN